MGKEPGITIVTPCLNAGSCISTALESVARQRTDSIEHIVVDGGSTDGTLDIVSRFPQTKIISGPDSGLYDALNKGAWAARFSYLGILNADDTFAPGALALFLDKLRSQRDIDIFSGAAEFCGANQKTEVITRRAGSRALSLDPATLLYGVPVFNARIYRFDLIDRVGGFNSDFKIAGDREFLLRCSFAGATNAILDDTVYRYVAHAGSMTLSGDKRARRAIYREHEMLARDFLARGDLPAAFRNAFKAWRAFEALKYVKAAMTTQEAGRALQLFGRLFLDDPAWITRIPEALRQRAEYA